MAEGLWKMALQEPALGYRECSGNKSLPRQRSEGGVQSLPTLPPKGIWLREENKVLWPPRFIPVP